MLLHTIIDPEVIWSQGAKDEEYNNKCEVIYDGISLEVIEVDQKTYTVNRILSSNLKDYLNPNLQPGSKIELILKSQE